jgi:hypothetical protein
VADVRPSDQRAADEERPPAMPRWVRVFAAALVVLALLFVAMHLRGGHGPRRHLAPRAHAP